jgi:hypothetical protein
VLPSWTVSRNGCAWLWCVLMWEVTRADRAGVQQHYPMGDLRLQPAQNIPSPLAGSALVRPGDHRAKLIFVSPVLLAGLASPGDECVPAVPNQADGLVYLADLAIARPVRLDEVHLLRLSRPSFCR